MTEAHDPYAAPASRVVESQAAPPTTRWRWVAYVLGALCIVPTAFVFMVFNIWGWPSVREIPALIPIILFLATTTCSGTLLIARRKLALWLLAAVAVSAIVILVQFPSTDARIVVMPVIAAFVVALFLRNRGALT